MAHTSSNTLTICSEFNPTQHRYRILLLKFVMLLTCFLIFFGALVTSHDAGLSVPDWPNSYGYNMFLFPPSLWIGGIFYEHVHRLIASTLGAMTLIFTVWTLMRDPRRNIKILSVFMLLAVTIQGIFGGLTVWYLLPDWISTTHAVLGQTFFLLTIAMTYFHSQTFMGIHCVPAANVIEKKTALYLLGLVYVQLIVAAYMRHSGAGLAVPDFPTIGHSWVPAFNDALLSKLTEMRHAFAPQLAAVTMPQVIVHLAHRTIAFILVGAAFYLWLSKGSERKVVSSILTIMLVQFSLGIIALLSGRHPFLTSLHVITGAILLGTVAYLNLKLFTKGKDAL